MGKEHEHIFQMCRACLLLSNSNFPIFEDVPQSDINIAVMLRNCAIQIEQNDAFPKTLCMSCFKKLQIGHSFIQNFRRSEELLIQQYLNECEEKIVIVKEVEESSSSNVELDINNTDINEDIFDLKFQEDSTDRVFNQEEADMESLVIKYEHGDKECESHDSDDQDFLIEQSVKLTQHYRIHKQDEKDCEFVECESEDISKEADISFLKQNKVDNSNNKKHCNVKQCSSRSRSLSTLLSCPLCSKTFKRFRLFSAHLTQHNREISCQLCSMEFDDADLYLEHYQMKHKYQCNICEKSFPRGDTYNRHMKAHNNTLPKFICPIENCLKTFTVRQSLHNHFRSVHSEKRNFLCNLCGASFKNYDNLRYHMKKHKGPSHLCTYCGKRFMQAVHLTYHMWRHTGVKPYKCTNCEKSFVSKKVLMTHLNKNCENVKKGKHEELLLKVENV